MDWQDLAQVLLMAFQVAKVCAPKQQEVTMNKSVSALAALSAIAALGLAQPAAASLTFSGSSGSLAAQAVFSSDGAGKLTVVLTNTSSADVLVPIDVLTGVFFDVNGVGTLTPYSALLTSGSSVFHDPDGQPAGGVVGGEWAYKDGLAAPHGATEGISSSGLGLFGPGDRFPGADLAPPDNPDGLQYGILSAGDNTATGNAKVTTDSGGLIKNSVTFVLSGLGSISDAALSVSNVSFQYGTALTEPNVPGGGGGGGGGGGAPEPATLALVALGLLGAGAARHRRRQV